MKGLGRAIGWTVVLFCIFWSRTYPSTVKVQTYVSKDGLIHSPLNVASGFLFAQQMEDSTRRNKADSTHGDQTRTIKLKDPNMAIFYAVIPGLVVHGSGHFYAGKTKTGFWLLGAEVAGASIVYVSVLVGYAASEAGEVSEVAELGALGGLLLFVGSWIYDVVKSPLVVKKQNEELLQRRHGELEFRIKDQSLRLVVKCRF